MHTSAHPYIPHTSSYILIQPFSGCLAVWLSGYLPTYLLTLTFHHPSPIPIPIPNYPLPITHFYTRPYHTIPIPIPIQADPSISKHIPSNPSKKAPSNLSKQYPSTHIPSPTPSLHLRFRLRLVVATRRVIHITTYPTHPLRPFILKRGRAKKKEEKQKSDPTISRHVALQALHSPRLCLSPFAPTTCNIVVACSCECIPPSNLTVLTVPPSIPRQSILRLLILVSSLALPF